MKSQLNSRHKVDATNIQEEKRAEKQSKYRELCADLRRQFPGYRRDVVSMGIGGLGTVTHRLVEDLRHLPTAGKPCHKSKGCSTLF